MGRGMLYNSCWRRRHPRVQHILGHAHLFKGKTVRFVCCLFYFQQQRGPGLFPLTLHSAQPPTKAPRKRSFPAGGDTSHLAVLKEEGMNILCHANHSFMVLCAVTNWLTRFALTYNDLGRIIYLSDSNVDSVSTIDTYKWISIFYQCQELSSEFLQLSLPFNIIDHDYTLPCNFYICLSLFKKYAIIPEVPGLGPLYFFHLSHISVQCCLSST